MLSIYRLLTGHDFISVSNIFTVAVMSVLTSAVDLIFYSKKELRRLELLVRHIICLFIEIAIVLSFAIYIGWISWSEPILIMAFVGMVVIVHGMIIAIDFYRTKLKTDEIMKKIKELNK